MEWIFTKLIPQYILKRLKKNLDLQKVIVNTGWLFFDRIFRMGVGFFVGTWIARYLGPEQYGMLSYTQAFVALFASLATLGLDGIVIREIVKIPDKKDEILGSAFFLKLVGGLITLIIINVTILYIRPENKVVFWMIFISSCSYIFQSFDTIDFWFQSQLQSKYTVYAKNFSFIIVSILKIVLIITNASVIWFAATFLIEVFLGAIGLIIVYKLCKLKIFRWKVDFNIVKSLLNESWPLILSGIVVMIYMRIDQIMLGQILGDEEVGIYTAATRLSEIWYFIPTTIVSSMAPIITKTKVNNNAVYLNQIQKLFNILSLIALPIAITMTFLSPPLMAMLYGNSYLKSGGVLSIHIWTAIFVFLGVGRNPWLLNEGLTRFSFATNSMGALVNILLNIIFIPRFGAVGAAVATLVSQIIASYLMNLFYRKTRPLFIMQSKAICFYWILPRIKALLHK
ncbi:flippase [Anoxybacillus flavithermus]